MNRNLTRWRSRRLGCRINRRSSPLNWTVIARAYPLGIMTRHEIVTMWLGDVPVAVTFCPLCNSAVVFDRRVDGQVYRFGVSGNLRNSDLVMWGRCHPKLVAAVHWRRHRRPARGRPVEILPSLLVGFGAFQRQYPDGVVLSPGGRNYSTNPYECYDCSARPFLFDGTVDDRLFATHTRTGDNPGRRGRGVSL